MTQTELQFRSAGGGGSQNQRLREYFLQRPKVWHAMPELGTAIGAWAVHSRVADLRTKFKMTIEQRQERVDGKTHSFYRYLPDGPAPENS